MSMFKRIGRLFVIKTRVEVWFVIFAIAMGAVERGQRYLQIYPGKTGWMFAVLATGVVFVAGAKLLDSVRPAPARQRAPVVPMRRRVSRDRRVRDARGSAARAPISSRKD